MNARTNILAFALVSLDLGSSNGAFAQPSSHVQFSSSTFVVNEGVRMASITVERRGNTNEPAQASVYYLSDGSTAQIGLDLDWADPIQLVFNPGETTSELVINILDDDLLEGHETAILSLEGSFDTAVGEPKQAVITIRDNETAPALARWHRLGNEANSLSAAVYGNGRFVAVGYMPKFLTSTNCTNWSTSWKEQAGTNRCTLSPLSFNPSEIAYGNGTFLAMEQPPLDVLLCARVRAVGISSNGIDWTVRQGPGAYAVTFGHGLFVALGGDSFDYGQHGIWTSSDGTNWTNRLELIDSWNGEERWNGGGVAFGNGIFVVAGGRWPEGTILVSSDAVVWTDVTGAGTPHLRHVTFGNGVFVVVGENTILTSSDGFDWTQRHESASDYLTKVSFGNGFFVASGYSDRTNLTLISSDAITWTRLKIVGDLVPTQLLNGPDCGHATLLAMDPNGLLESDPVVRLDVRSAGCAELTLRGAVGHGYRIEYTDNFLRTNDWKTLTTLSMSNSVLEWKDTASTNISSRVYRAVLLP